MKRVLVTGASGFIGRALVGRLQSCSDVDVVAGIRQREVMFAGSSLALGNLEDCCFSAEQLQGITGIVHAAARVHVMRERSIDPVAAFHRVNVDASVQLARAAAAAGVRRFVYISSIKVNGEASLPGVPFTAADTPCPIDPYGLSKAEAEFRLAGLSRDTGMELVIVRPPLVYGPGVSANFRSMMRWLQHGVPLPLGNISNRRSLVALENLVDLLVRCLEHPGAAGNTFLVSDGEDVSTSELLLKLGRALGRSARLLDGRYLGMLLMATGRNALHQRLFGSLQVDMEKTRSLLDWKPPVPMELALKRTADAFLSESCR